MKSKKEQGQATKARRSNESEQKLGNHTKATKQGKATKRKKNNGSKEQR